MCIRDSPDGSDIRLPVAIDDDDGFGFSYFFDSPGEYEVVFEIDDEDGGLVKSDTISVSVRHRWSLLIWYGKALGILTGLEPADRTWLDRSGLRSASM